MMGEGRQAETMKRPYRWPLVATLDSRNQNFNYDARLINAYAEKDPDTGFFTIEKRPGSVLQIANVGIGFLGQGITSQPYFATSGTGGFSGVPANQLLWVINNVAYYQIYGTPATSYFTQIQNLGSVVITNGTGIPTSYNRAWFSSIPPTASSPGIILFGSGNPGQVQGNYANAYAVTTTGVSAFNPYFANGTITTITPGVNGYPSNAVPGFVYLDGYTYVMDIYGSIWQTTTQQQVTNWSVNYITAQTTSDLAICLARQLIYVIAIKQWTTQVFYDAGNAQGSSLSPVPGAVFDVGCISSDTFAELDGVLFWAAQSRSGTHSVVMLANLQMTTISNQAVERQLDLSSQGNIFYAYAYSHMGHKFYVITNITTNITMVYDIGEQLWYLWTDYQGNYYNFGSRIHSPFATEWHQDLYRGGIYEVDGDYVYPNDAGNIFPVDIYTPNFDAGIDRKKYLSQMRINADQTPGSILNVRCSDDDYQSWSNFRNIDLSRKRPILNECGTFYRRAYHFRHYANTPFRISSVDLQMDIGTL
jgi:hypothetical protein